MVECTDSISGSTNLESGLGTPSNSGNSNASNSVSRIRNKTYTSMISAWRLIIFIPFQLQDSKESITESRTQ
ncbi:hypothetical protein ACJ72_02325 [Emergomyces africanus]|uniref:Uncharacterized protein n=1 Tax=Emergomyces africanus TaxID=1955775 RepID=A0A1B7P2R7_9EURO|nr:hypothetical protein ACJ72_02325 [Emergomyces africanus]